MRLFYLLFLWINVLKVNGTCPSGTKLFTLPDGSQDCIFCSECPRGELIKKNCTVNDDTVCEPCPSNTYYVDNGPKCLPCTQCVPGEYLTRNCSLLADRLCEPCPTGNFSSGNNSEDCTPCNKCAEHGVLKVCTNQTDAECKSAQGRAVPAAVEGILIGLAVLVFFLFLLFIFLHTRRWKKLWKDGQDWNIYPEEIQFLPRATELPSVEKTVTNESYAKNGFKKRLNRLKGCDKTEQIKHFLTSVGALIITSKQRESKTETKDSGVQLYEDIDSNSEKQVAESAALPRGSAKEEFNAASKGEENEYFQTVTLVGQNYIMTSYWTLKEKLAIDDPAMGKMPDFTRLGDSGVFVTFDDVTEPIYNRARLLRTEPVYWNEQLDVIVFEIQKPDNFELPEPCCPYKRAIQTMINSVTILDYENGNKLKKGKVVPMNAQKLSKTSSAISAANEYLKKEAERYKCSLRLRNRNEGLLTESMQDFVDIEESKIIFSSLKDNLQGSPGFYLDAIDDLYRFTCMVTYTIPKLFNVLLKSEQAQYPSTYRLKAGTYMSAVYDDMVKRNKQLAEELFHDW